MSESIYPGPVWQDWTQGKESLLTAKILLTFATLGSCVIPGKFVSNFAYDLQRRRVVASRPWRVRR